MVVRLYCYISRLNRWKKNADYDFFNKWHLDAMQADAYQPLGITYLIWGIALFLIVTPFLSYLVGKRWYCSWICGCGGLAETAGDSFRQLSSKKLTILGINTNGDSKALVMKYLNGFPESVEFSYLIDPDQSVHKNYSQRDMPTVLVIDSEGVIQARVPWVGADQLVKFLKKFL